SDMEGADLANVLTTLRGRFGVCAETEVTIEGRVRGFTAEKAQTWVEAGANRFSLGLQTSNTKLRRRLGRIADRAEIAATLNALAETGAVVIVDLIYGLPGQTPPDLVEDIRFLAEETAIDGLDLYALKVFPGSPLEKAVQQNSLPPLPDAPTCAEIFLQADAELARRGFEGFTPKHWRRSTRERSVYNKLAKETADILPFGSAGGGRIGEYALMQHPALEDYTKALDAGRKPALAMPSPRTPQSLFKGHLAAALNRCALPPHDQWGLPLATAAQIAANWLEAGLIEARGNSANEPAFTLTPRGIFWHERLQASLLQGMARRTG
ncbi:MAG: radical SAM protein, partial [Verrucomicrobiota bacterium]